MIKIQKKYWIKIPNYITLIYCKKKKIITFIGPLTSKSLKLKFSIFKFKNVITLTNNSFLKVSNEKKKKNKTLQGTTISLIKQIVLETFSIFYKKLKLIGVGFRAFSVENFKDKLFLFKLGYSHPIYFITFNKLKIFCLKLTKIFIYNNSYQNISQLTSFIRSYKKPEPYKGKGLLYDNEKIILKESKKI